MNALPGDREQFVQALTDALAESGVLAHVDVLRDAVKEVCETDGFAVLMPGEVPPWMSEVLLDDDAWDSIESQLVGEGELLCPKLYRLINERESDHQPEHRNPELRVGEGPMLCKHCDGYLCYGEDGLGELMHVRDLAARSTTEGAEK